MVRSTWGAGGAPAVVMVSPDRSWPAAAGDEYMDVSTVGAQHMWVTPLSPISLYISTGSTRLRQTWVAPMAVTPHVKHQPLQWNMGSVHR